MPRTVVCLTHDARQRHAWSALLRRAGFPVVEAVTPEEALRLGSTDDAALVVVDGAQLAADGVDLCRRLKARGAAGPLVLHLSPRSSDAGRRVAALERGADVSLVEPIEPPELVAAVAALLRLDATLAPRGRRPTDEAVFTALPEGLALGEVVAADDGSPVDYRILDVNPAFGDLTGIDPAVARGRTLRELVPDAKSSWIELCANVARTGVARRTENFAAGMNKWLETTVYSVGRGRFATLFRDVTERKRGRAALELAQKTLRRSEAEARQRLAEIEAIYHSAPIGLCVFDRDLRWVRLNEEIAEIDGVPVAAHVGHTPREIVPGVADQAEAALRQVLATGKPLLDFEVSGTTLARPGSMRVWNTRCVPIKDGEGRVVGISMAAEEITERKRMEAALRQSEADFRTLADNIAQFAWMADATGGIFWYNRRWFEYTGTTLEDMRGWGWQTVHHPDHLPRVMAKIRQCFETGGAWEDTFPLRGRDGTYRWFLSRALPIRDEQGRIVRWFGTNTDVTEQRESEQALRRSEQKYRALVESLSEGVWAVDERGITTFVNGEMASILGYTVEELRGRPLNDFFQPSDVATLLGGPDRIRPRQVERTLTGRDGRRVTVLASTAPLINGSGAFRGVIAGVVNITERRRHERREKMTSTVTALLGDSLDEAETVGQLASALVQSFADWVIVMLTDSGEAVRPIGLHRDPARQRLIDAICAYPAGCAAFRSEAVAKGEAVLLAPITPAVLDAQTDDAAYRQLIVDAGARSVVVVPIQLGRRNLGTFACVRTDEHAPFGVDDVQCLERIASRAGLAIENARLFRAAQEANQQKDEFIATLSHELRTPLNAILGWTRILQDHVLDDAHRARALGIIERNARIQSQLVSDILDVSRIIAGKIRLDKSDLEIAPLVERVVETMRPAADERGLHLRFTASGGGLVHGDPARLEQIVWNLLSNALKFTAEGGHVDVTLRAARPGRIEFEVRDDGTGISREFLPHVFDRFRQANASFSRPSAGLGLGLAIVKHLVEVHDGSIRAESDGEGRGAAFTVSLPLAHQPTAEQEPSRSLASAPTLNGLHVLAVDDDAEVRELLQFVVGASGATITTVADGAEALRTIRHRPPDVLLLDLAMPGEDGFAVLQNVRAAGLTAPAIAVSAHAREEDRVRALAAGFAAHIAKPVDPGQLIAALARELPSAALK